MSSTMSKFGLLAGLIGVIVCLVIFFQNRNNEGEPGINSVASGPELPAIETDQAGLALNSRNSSESMPSDEADTGLSASALRFRDDTKASGVDFVHHADRTEDRYLPEVMGPGVVVADFNNDGAPDIILVNGGSMSSLSARPENATNQMFLNDGKGVFANVTEQWRLPGNAYGMGGTAGDYDNDGLVDLYLTTFGGGDQLLRNAGDHFEDVTESSRIQPDSHWSSSAGFFDADNDGDLDLYVVRYLDYTLQNAVKCYTNRIHIYCTPVLYNGVPDRLLLNNGDGTFTDATSTHLLVNGEPVTSIVPGSGVESAELDVNSCKGMALGIGDLDDNGFADIYVANDASRNLLFVNRGDGFFDETGRRSGVAYGELGNEQAGMGIDFSDIDNNRLLDIVCTNFQNEPVNVYCQESAMFFIDRTDQNGPGRTSRARLKFGVDFFDADNDGDEDLLVANGHIYDNLELFLNNISFAQTNSLFESDGKGRFTDVSGQAGSALEDKQVSRGLATADFNGDGKLDYVVTNNGGTAQIATNVTQDTGNFVSFWLVGEKANRSAIGAKITATCGETVIRREIFGAASYLSANDTRLHLGLGKSDRIDQLEIRWPGGEMQVLENVEANFFYRIVEGRQPTKYIPGEFTGGE